MKKMKWGGGLSSFYSKNLVAAALKISSEACGVSPRRLTTNTRAAKVAFARQLAMYLCHVVGDMSLRDVAAAFGRDRTTVSHACHAIEDRRDCPLYDKQIEYLEARLRDSVREIIDEALQLGGRLETKSLSLIA
ncbi:MAG: helix-turn-helix domain-containing protein [Parvularculaceae bacterium]